MPTGPIYNAQRLRQPLQRTMMGLMRWKCTSVIISFSAGWKNACLMFLRPGGRSTRASSITQQGARQQPPQRPGTVTSAHNPAPPTPTPRAQPPPAGPCSPPVHDVQLLPLGRGVAEPVGVRLQRPRHLAPLAAKRWPHPHVRQRVYAALQGARHSRVGVAVARAQDRLHAAGAHSHPLTPARPTLPRMSFSCCTSVARSAFSFSRCCTELRSVLISCTTCENRPIHNHQSSLSWMSAFSCGQQRGPFLAMQKKNRHSSPQLRSQPLRTLHPPSQQPPTLAAWRLSAER